MSAQQRELCLRVVKTIDIRPTFHRVAGLAAKWRPVGPFPRHPVVELALVRILVARGAGAVLKLEGKNLVRPPPRSHLVAIRTRNGHVPASANRVLRCFAIVNVERWKSSTVWHSSQRLLYGAAANWLSCASLWQSVQTSNFTL